MYWQNNERKCNHNQRATGGMLSTEWCVRHDSSVITTPIWITSPTISFWFISFLVSLLFYSPLYSPPHSSLLPLSIHILHSSPLFISSVHLFRSSLPFISSIHLFRSSLPFIPSSPLFISAVHILSSLLWNNSSIQIPRSSFAASLTAWLEYLLY